MKKIGRIGRERQARRRQWIKDHPPNHEGYWVCHICNRWVAEEDMRLDHDEPKGSTPKEIADSDENLKPAHSWCNLEKGSKRLPKTKIKRKRLDVW